MTTTKPCTLVIEDDRDSFEWIELRLAKYGYEPVWASTLQQGMKKLADGPCCVILDLGLPDGNGAEILREIRARKLPIKVAVITGNRDSAAASEAILLQPDAFFLKPVDGIELVTWLKTVCP